MSRPPAGPRRRRRTRGRLMFRRRRRQPANDDRRTVDVADGSSRHHVVDSGHRDPDRHSSCRRPRGPSRPGSEQVAVLDAPSGRSSSSSGTTASVAADRDRRRPRVTAVPRRRRPAPTPCAARPKRARSSRSRRSTPPCRRRRSTPARRLPASGFGYLETRDGTTLSVNVVLPGPPDGGPYPTVVEYSGYQPSDPNSFGFRAAVHRARLRLRRRQHARQRVQRRLVRLLRAAQLLDGYDVIETVAAQPWVARTQGRHGRRLLPRHQPALRRVDAAAEPGRDHTAVGDRRQLRQRAPPRRASSTPGSAWSGRSSGWTRRAPEGQEWAADRIADGDTVVRGQPAAAPAEPRTSWPRSDANPYYSADVGDPLAPRTFVDQIDVPVFLAGAWQDEQTGGHFATMLDRFTGTDHFYATLVNGLHTESIGAASFARLRRVPRPLRGPARPVTRRGPRRRTRARRQHLRHRSGRPAARPVHRPDATSRRWPTFEAEPPIQVLFEEGAADGALPGAPVPRWSQSFEAWPVPGAVATPWYLGADGTLSAEVPAERRRGVLHGRPVRAPGHVLRRLRRAARIWTYDVQWQWQQPPEGTAASFVSAPLAADTVVVGSGSADLWIRVDAADTDLEVTISEIRPDGQEVYVQSGWLRASMRALDEVGEHASCGRSRRTSRTTPSPAAAGEWTPVRVELLPSPTPSAPARNCGSRSMPPATAVPSGRSRRSPPARPSRSRSVPISRRGSCCRSCLASTCPQPYPTCTLRGQPCRAAPSRLP